LVDNNHEEYSLECHHRLCIPLSKVRPEEHIFRGDIEDFGGL